jgi:endonuclease/exonuclease/phosphatase family metal-dependent hydrolase
MTLSRWPITSVRNLPLPSWPVPGHMNDHQAVIEAVIDGPRPLRIYNTHLNYLSEEQRLDQVARLLAFIGEAPERSGPVSAPGLSAPGPEDDWIVLPDGKFPQMPQAAMLLGDLAGCLTERQQASHPDQFAVARLQISQRGPHRRTGINGVIHQQRVCETRIDRAVNGNLAGIDGVD